jgi:NADH-ubiquinone oxidoreductase chain 4
MVLYMPVFTILFFLFTLFNCAVPLSLNWVGEFLSLAGIFQKSPLTGILGATGIVLSAVYSIWFYNKIVYGSFSKFLKPTIDINRREFMLLLPLLISTVCFGFLPNFILNTLHITISSLLYII